MRRHLCLFVVGLCACGQGCNLVVNMSRNAVFEATRNGSAVMEEIRDNEAANAAWVDFQNGNSAVAYSTDFARGFKQGYVDYLYSGGTGNPPPTPPVRYWKSSYQTPEGHLAAQDWFAGFKQGVAAAKQAGNRELTIVPLYFPVDNPQFHKYYALPDNYPTPLDRVPARGSPPANESQLPMPRPEGLPTIKPGPHLEEEPISKTTDEQHPLASPAPPLAPAASYTPPPAVEPTAERLPLPVIYSKAALPQPWRRATPANTTPVAPMRPGADASPANAGRRPASIPDEIRSGGGTWPPTSKEDSDFPPAKTEGE